MISKKKNEISKKQYEDFYKKHGIKKEIPDMEKVRIEALKIQKLLIEGKIK